MFAKARRTIQVLARRLKEGDLAERRAAAESLSELCYELREDARTAIPLLVEHLSDADEELGDCIKWALVWCGSASVDPLIQCLVSANPLERSRACRALGSLGEDAYAARALLPRLLDDSVSSVQQDAAWALGQLGDTSQTTIDTLFEMASSGASETRASALHALGNIGTVLDDRASLLARKDLVMQALYDPSEDVRTSACYLLEQLPLAAQMRADLLAKLLEQDQATEVRTACLRQLRELARFADLSSTLPTLSRAVVEQRPDAADACEVLAAMGHKARAAVPQLIQALNSSQQLALPAADALWEIDRRCEESLPVLASLFDNNPETVCDLVCKLGTAAKPLLPHVLATLESDDWDSQWAAADALGHIRSADPTVLAALAKALGHKSGRVQSSAANAFGRIGPEAVPMLVTILGDVDDSRSEWAADALARMGHRAVEAEPYLRAALRDPREDVRVWASIAVGHVLSDPIVVPVLIKLLKKEARPDVQEGAARALAAIGPGARKARSALAAARSSVDPNVQQAVEEALASIERSTLS